MRRFYYLRAALITTLLFALSGCWKQFWSPEIVASPDVSQAFPGIHQLARNGGVDVVLVHGMCTHGEKWAKDSIESLSRKLGYNPDKLEFHKVHVEGSRSVVFKSVVPVGQTTVNVSAIVWSPILFTLKKQLCYDQKRKSDMCRSEKKDEHAFTPRRDLGNRIGKDVILDDCLADAMIYQGQARQQINEQMKVALLTASTPGYTTRTKEQLLKDAAGRNQKLVVVAESLGSKASLDALALLAFASCDSPEYSAAKSTYLRISTVFLAANQIPMLQLADQRLDSSGPVDHMVPSCEEQKEMFTKEVNPSAIGAVLPSDPLASLAQRFKDVAPDKSAPKAMINDSGLTQILRPPLVVAFSDPNDLLTFELKNSATSKADYATLDVRVSNTFSWLGVLAEPYTTHTSYLQTDDVVKYIACGNKQPTPCP